MSLSLSWTILIESHTRTRNLHFLSERMYAKAGNTSLKIHSQPLHKADIWLMIPLKVWWGTKIATTSLLLFRHLLFQFSNRLAFRGTFALRAIFSQAITFHSWKDWLLQWICIIYSKHILMTLLSYKCNCRPIKTLDLTIIPTLSPMFY